MPQVAEFGGPGPELTRASLAAAVAAAESRFGAPRAEGLYLRACLGGRTVDRCKVVRADFIAGNQHWTKGGYVRNDVQEAAYLHQ